MTIRLWSGLRVAAAAVALAVGAASVALAGPDEQEKTEDIIYMVDGRELHGQIISESDYEVIFQLVDRALGLNSRMTLRVANIARIERDVPLESSQEVEASASDRGTDTRDSGERTRFGRGMVTDEEADVPSIYVVSMKGQMGTDIHPSIYHKLAEDVEAIAPDLLVIKMDSSDYEDSFAAALSSPQMAELSRPDFDAYKELVDIFRNDLSNVPQVMWVQDSVGISSTVALAWPQLYMTPDARLGGMRAVYDLTGADKWSDTDVRAKMMAAWMGSAKSLLEHGGYGLELADAMVDPTYKLSATFKGREVIWSLHDKGEFIVDSDDEETANFNAKVAEDLLINAGTVENLDDLAFLLGYREYRKVGEKGAKLVDDYRGKWRRAFENTKTWWADYQQHSSWASGTDTVKWLGKAKSDLEKIIKTMERYEAVETRWKSDFGTTKMQLEVMVEQLKETLQSLKRGGGTGRGGGGMGRR
jgi:hypothetical protein